MAAGLAHRRAALEQLLRLGHPRAHLPAGRCLHAARRGSPLQLAAQRLLLQRPASWQFALRAHHRLQPGLRRARARCVVAGRQRWRAADACRPRRPEHPFRNAGRCHGAAGTEHVHTGQCRLRSARQRQRGRCRHPLRSALQHAHAGCWRCEQRVAGPDAARCGRPQRLDRHRAGQRQRRHLAPVARRRTQCGRQQLLPIDQLRLRRQHLVPAAAGSPAKWWLRGRAGQRRRCRPDHAVVRHRHGRCLRQRRTRRPVPIERHRWRRGHPDRRGHRLGAPEQHARRSGTAGAGLAGQWQPHGQHPTRSLQLHRRAGHPGGDGHARRQRVAGLDAQLRARRHRLAELPAAQLGLGRQPGDAPEGRHLHAAHRWQHHRGLRFPTARSGQRHRVRARHAAIGHAHPGQLDRAVRLRRHGRRQGLLRHPIGQQRRLELAPDQPKRRPALDRRTGQRCRCGHARPDRPLGAGARRPALPGCQHECVPVQRAARGRQGRHTDAGPAHRRHPRCRRTASRLHLRPGGALAPAVRCAVGLAVHLVAERPARDGGRPRCRRPRRLSRRQPRDPLVRFGRHRRQPAARPDRRPLHAHDRCPGRRHRQLRLPLARLRIGHAAHAGRGHHRLAEPGQRDRPVPLQCGRRRQVLFRRAALLGHERRTVAPVRPQRQRAVRELRLWRPGRDGAARSRHLHAGHRGPPLPDRRQRLPGHGAAAGRHRPGAHHRTGSDPSTRRAPDRPAGHGGRGHRGRQHGDGVLERPQRRRAAHRGRLARPGGGHAGRHRRGAGQRGDLGRRRRRRGLGGRRAGGPLAADPVARWCTRRRRAALHRHHRHRQRAGRAERHGRCRGQQRRRHRGHLGAADLRRSAAQRIGGAAGRRLAGRRHRHGDLAQQQHRHPRCVRCVAGNAAGAQPDHQPDGAGHHRDARRQHAGRRWRRH